MAEPEASILSRRGFLKTVGFIATAAVLPRSSSTEKPVLQTQTSEGREKVESVADLARQNFDRLMLTGKEAYSGKLFEAMEVNLLELDQFNYSVDDSEQGWGRISHTVFLSGEKEITGPQGEKESYWVSLSTRVATPSFGQVADVLTLTRMNIRLEPHDLPPMDIQVESPDDFDRYSGSDALKFGLVNGKQGLGLLVVRSKYADYGGIAGYYIPFGSADIDPSKEWGRTLKLNIGNDDSAHESFGATYGMQHQMAKKITVDPVVVPGK